MSNHQIMDLFHSKDYPISIPFDGSLYNAFQACIQHYNLTNFNKSLSKLHQKMKLNYPLTDEKKKSNFITEVLSKNIPKIRFSNNILNNLSDCALSFNIKILLITSSKPILFGRAENDKIHLLLKDQDKLSLIYPKLNFDIYTLLSPGQSLKTTSNYVLNCGFKFDSQYMNSISVYQVYNLLQQINCHYQCNSKFDKIFIVNFLKKLKEDECAYCSCKIDKFNTFRCKYCSILFCKNKKCYVDLCLTEYGTASCFICKKEIMKKKEVVNECEKFQINIKGCEECDKVRTLVNFCESCGNFNLNEDLLEDHICLECKYYLADRNGLCSTCLNNLA